MPGLHSAVAVPLVSADTERLSTRRLVCDDGDDLAVLLRDPEVWRFDLTIEDAEVFLGRQLRLWSECGFGGCAVRDLRDGSLLGIVGLGVATLEHPRLPPVTIGWRFASATWGHGYATEAATALLHQAFGPMQLDRVGCVTDAENHRSVAVARRLGMYVVGQEAVLGDGVRDAAALILQVDRNTWLARHRD